MASAAHYPAELRDHRTARREQGSAATIKAATRPLLAFWTKVNSDWVFNLSGLLAYSFLMSIFPLLVVLLAVAGFVVGSLGASQAAELQTYVGKTLPGGATVLAVVGKQLSHSAGLLLIVGILVAAYSGSRLFVVIAQCFNIIFRVRSRDFLHQNLMASGMLALYAVLIPLIALGSVIPSAVVHLVSALGKSAVTAFLVQVVGIVISVGFAFVLLAAIYAVVPNRKMRWAEIWRGALVASALLVVYDVLFPVYESHFLHPGNYGSVAGFAVVILVFFYYFAFLLLIGAEVGAWTAGQRQPLGNITVALQEMQARGGAGEVSGGARSPAAGDVRGQEGSGTAAPVGAPTGIAHGQMERTPDRQPVGSGGAKRGGGSAGERQALAAVLVAGAAAVLPVVGWLVRRGDGGRAAA